MKCRWSIRRSAVWLIPLLAVLVPACSDDPVAPGPEIRTDSIPDGILGPFVPGLVSGDGEFNQHGPLVTVNAELYLQGTDSLMCCVYMKAEETEPDWTTAEGEWDILLYQAPDGWKITGMCSASPACHMQYIDYDNDRDWLFCQYFIFQCEGDTEGPDVNNGTCLWVQVRCAEVEIQKK